MRIGGAVGGGDNPVGFEGGGEVGEGRLATAESVEEREIGQDVGGERSAPVLGHVESVEGALQGVGRPTAPGVPVVVSLRLCQ